jgi:hypothetical protein
MTDGYATTTTVEELPHGKLTTTTVWTADKLIRREAEALARAGYDISHELPEIRKKQQRNLMLISARKLAAEGSSRGHREAIRWYLDHADEALRIAGEIANLVPKQIRDFPEAQQYEGVFDANLDGPDDAFTETERAARRSMERTGRHESDRVGEFKDRAKLAAEHGRRAEANRTAPLDEDVDLAAIAGADDTWLDIDVPGLRANLESVRGTKTKAGSIVAALMGTEKPSEATRKWIRRHQDELREIIARHVRRVQRSRDGDAVLVPGGTWIHCRNLRLFGQT